MSDVPVQLIVVAFQDEKSADEMLKKLKKAGKEKLIRIENAAVLRKDAKGKLHIKETADLGGGKGAVLGGVVGAAIGLLAGPALIVPAAVGALIGGLAGNLRDTGFSDERLKKLGEGLKPGSSVIVALVELTWVEQVKEQIAEAGADAMTTALSADITAQLEAGHETAYTAITTREGLTAVARVTEGNDFEQGGAIVVDDSGVFGSQFLATKDGFVVKGIDVDDEGAVAFSVAGVSEEAEGGSPEEGK